MKLKLTLLAIILTLFAITALADQAAYITKEQAEKAAAFLKDKKQIRHYCAPCDDKGDKVEDISAVEAVAVADSKPYWEVKVNGEGIDLAYVYFQDKKGKWKNLAKEMKIKVDDVPKSLP
ncbi:MAG TPA: hypothetical protein PLK77_04815 [Pyrinomonadaceae bacterium]|nr:hypothetical protein [Pyrinomonadaceae bacterium]